MRVITPTGLGFYAGLSSGHIDLILLYIRHAQVWALHPPDLVLEVVKLVLLLELVEHLVFLQAHVVVVVGRTVCISANLLFQGKL